MPVVQEWQETRLQSLGWEDPLEGMATAPVFLSVAFQGQRAWWATYNPRGRKKSDMTEVT